MKPAAMIFDFDGVILDSVSIKTDAMRRLFASERPEHVEAIVALHMRHGGFSRYRNFEMVHADILKRPLTAEASAELGRQFESLVLDAIMRCAEIPGVRAVLEAHAGKVPLFVASGTPDEELKRIAAARGLDRYFSEMHGSPRTKIEIISDLLSRHALDPLRCVFVGDAMTDFDAARRCRVPFVGVVRPEHANPFERGVCIVPDLTSFDLMLRNISPADLAIRDTA